MKRLAVCCLAILASVSLFAQPTKRKPMNIVFYLVDDLGWADLGYEGSTFYETPNIDSFSKVGVRFNQAYAACHVCSPSRASILSGEYPARLHLTDWLPGRKNFPFQKFENVRSVQHLPYNQQPLPVVLKENGYRTAIFGKWHLGEDSNSTGRQGFDIHVPDYNKGWPNGTYFNPYGMKGLEGGVPGEYLTDRLTAEALKWVEKNKDHPFFLYLAQYAVHDPIQGRGDLVVKYEKKLAKMPKSAQPPFVLEGNPDDGGGESAVDDAHRGFRVFPDRTVKIKQRQDNVEFAAMVDCMDENFGKVMAKLKELGLEDNTIVIFFSDNGGMSAANFGNPSRNIQPVNLDKAYSTANLPLRGGKGWMYEGGIREPLLIYWPHHGEHGVTSDVPVTSTDFYSTLLDMVGIDPKPRGNNGIDGSSLVPILTGDKAGIDQLRQKPLFWHFPQYSNHGAQSPGGAVRYGDYKLIEYYENNTVQLFNLKNDPGEQHDLAKTEPEKARELTEMLHKWRKDVNAVMPVPNPNYHQGNTWPGKGIRGEANSPYDHPNR